MGSQGYGQFRRQLPFTRRRHGLQFVGARSAMNRPSKSHACLATLLIFLLTFFAARPATGQVAVSENRARRRATARAAAPNCRSAFELDQLPATAWKMHPGDLTHGEAVGLTKATGSPALREKAPTEAVWFRQTVQIPDTLNGYDLTGARIWFQFHAGANGPMPQIIYFNYSPRGYGRGSRTNCARRRRASRRQNCHCSQASSRRSTPRHFLGGATLRIEFPENRPNPADLAQEFLSASVLIPSLTPGGAEGKMNPMATLNSAIAAVDVAALDAAETASRWRRPRAGTIKIRHQPEGRARAQLEALRPLLETATFHLTGNSHIDAAWLWPSTETVDVVRRTFELRCN